MNKQTTTHMWPRQLEVRISFLQMPAGNHHPGDTNMLEKGFLASCRASACAMLTQGQVTRRGLQNSAEFEAVQVLVLGRPK